MTADRRVDVVHNAEAHRYELRVGGQLAGYSEYHDRTLRGVRTFFHTEVLDAFQGAGLGTRLAKAALDNTRASGLGVIAECEFIAGYIQDHADYWDLLKPAVE